MTNDDLRRILHEAVPSPTRSIQADEVLHRGRRRQRAKQATAGCLGVLGVLASVAIPFALRSERNDRQPISAPAPVAVPAASAACPQTYVATARMSLWVPTSPTADGASGRIVPAETPRGAVLCKYTGEGSFGLVGAKHLGDVELIPEDLNLPLKTNRPRGTCALGRPATPYLLRLDYLTGVVWVTTMTEDNLCAEVTNGAATSTVIVGRDFAASYDAGRWSVAVPSPDDPCAGSFGRAGQEQLLLPAGAIALRVCDGSQLLARIINAEKLRSIQQLLNSAPGYPTDGSCLGVPTIVRMLAADYENGRGVSIGISQGSTCGPYAGSVGSARLVSLTDAQVMQLLALLEQ